MARLIPSIGIGMPDHCSRSLAMRRRPLRMPLNWSKALRRLTPGGAPDSDRVALASWYALDFDALLSWRVFDWMARFCFRFGFFICVHILSGYWIKIGYDILARLRIESEGAAVKLLAFFVYILDKQGVSSPQHIL